MKKRIIFILFLVWGSILGNAQGRILSGEYFWGSIDPGNGNGTAFTAQDGSFGEVIEQIIANGQTVPNLSSPARFNVRVKDYNNLWGPTYKKVIFLTTNLPTAYNVSVTQAEYFFGSVDPGAGSATQLVVFDGNWNEAIETASSSNTSWNLTEGLKLFNVRAKDGLGNWGPLYKKTLSIQNPSANPRFCKIQAAEYFFGTTDPGTGSATTLLVLDGAWSDAVETAYKDNVSWSLSNGMTVFNVRVKDESNNWGPLFKKAISVQDVPSSVRSCHVVAGEFYFGTFDPGAGSGTTILAFDGAYDDALEQAFQAGYAWNVNGTTLFNIRFKDESNQWGPVYKKTVIVNETPTPRDWKITFAEYFFGIFDPGAGTGNVIVAFDGNLDNGVEILLRSSLTWEQTSGSTLFNIRVKDESNQWGPVFKRTIFFNGSNPTVNLISQGESISRCPDFSVTLDYVGPNGYNVVWENGTIGNTVTFTPTASGYFSMYAYLGNSYLYDSIYVNIYSLPDALINPAGEILVCASSNVLLTASAGTNYSYQWYQNGNIITGSTQQTYFPTQVGAYTVLVTDNTTTCQQLSSPTTFYLTAPIFPTGTVSTSCNPNGVELTAPIGTGNTYQWKKNGTNISGATNATYLATTVGNYNVVVTNGQCVSTSGTTVVSNTGSTVNASITPSGTVSLCDGGNVQLTAASGSGYTYQWKKDGVIIVGATAQTYLASSAGSYTVVVTATGCSLTSAATIVQIGNTVVPSVSITAGTNTICSGSTVTFTAGAINGGTSPVYQWKVNGINAGTNSSTFASSSLANNDVVSVVMTSNAACASPSNATSNTITMTVNNSVTPSLLITAAANPICSGSSFVLTATPSNGGTAPIYQWKKNGTNISGAIALSYTTTSATNGDVFTCVLTANNSCQTSANATSNAITAQVNTSLSPSVTISASATTICAGSSVTFTATPTNGGTTPAYQWKLNGVNVGTNASTYTSTTLANNDVVTAVLTSNASCLSTTTATSNALTMTTTTSVTPSVSISASATTICAGSSVTFTATPTNGGTTPAYQWKKNGVNVGTNAATYSSTTLANNDVITAVLTSNASCLSTTTATSNALTMTTTTSVTPSILIAAAENPICSGSSFILSATSNNGGSAPTYQWQKNGTNISGAIGLLYSTTSVTNGDVFTCVMTSNNTCQTSGIVTSNIVTAQITSSITPTVSITSNTVNICSGETVTFIGTATGGGVAPLYQWKKNGVNIAGAISLNYTTSAISNGDVFTLLLTSNASCLSTTTATSNTLTMTTTTSVTPSVSITAGTNTICSGSTVTFTAGAINGGTSPVYQWKVNGINAGTNSSTFASSSLANNDVVSVVMTSNAACASPSNATSNTITMTVNNSVTPSLLITAAANPICSGSSFVLTATPSNGGTAPIYQWKKNGTNISGAIALSYTTTSATNGDVFTCVLTANNSCQTSANANSNAITAQVNTSLSPSVTISASATTICAGSSVTFTATPTNGGTTPAYQWKLNGVNVGTNASTYTSTTLANNDVITAVLTSNASCLSTTTATSNALTMTITSQNTYYSDADGDGFGNINLSVSSCLPETGFVLNGTDCNDGNANINPNSQEVCGNGVDDNCNISVDENCSVSGCMDITACNYNMDATINDNSCSYPETYYNCDGFCISDIDGDGVCDQLEILGCTDPLACNFNPNATELDASCVMPQAEVCNGLDDNCNGAIDEDLIFSDYFFDADNDGYGTSLLGSFCSAPQEAVLLSGDCNDNSDQINPGVLELCNGVDDNCNNVIDEGATAGSVTSTNVITKLYPTCSGTNLMAANLNLGTNTLPTAGNGLDLWYKFTAQRNTLRAGLSAATGDNAIEIYQQVGNCLQLLGSEHEVSVSNQTLFYDDLVVGNEYYVACRSLGGTPNPSAKICFNHFDGTTCDHVYSNGTGVYANVCSSFKAIFKGNVSNYVFNVNSASSAGNPITITPWSYTTPTSSSIITRLGTLLPANFTTNPIVYGLTIGVTYVLQDAAGNNTYISADGTIPCSATLNSEAPVVLRLSDRCPTIKSITSSIATDRQVCGALRYQWEFTQVLPVAAPPAIVLGGLNTNILFLNSVPGMANGKTYNVRVRSIHSSGSVGEWGVSHCMKTTGSGMVMEDNSSMGAAMIGNDVNSNILLFPNPSHGEGVSIFSEKGWENDWVEIEILNAQGQRVWYQESALSGNQFEIENTEDLSSGLYTIQIKENGQRHVMRWIINR